MIAPTFRRRASSTTGPVLKQKHALKPFQSAQSKVQREREREYMNKVGGGKLS
jgi:hypothetical protein